MASRTEMTRAVYSAVCGDDNYPDLKHLEQYASSLDVEFTEATYRHIFESNDKDSDGKLSATEFRDLSDRYPKLLECLYHRMVDKGVIDDRQKGVDGAQDRADAVAKRKDRVVKDMDELHRELEGCEREAAAELQLLEEERAKEAAARAKEDAERHDAMSSKQIEGIHQAIGKTARGVCAEKRQQFYASVSEDEIIAFGKDLAKVWKNKDGDLIDELCDNLIAPDTVHSKLSVIAEAARTLHATKGDKYPGKNRLELLVMALYTMAGPDIDALMTFDNVPTYDDDHQAPWENYAKKYGHQRNGAIFSAVNWAMRTASDPKKKDTKEYGEAWDTCKKWIKYIGLLVSICVSHDPNTATMTKDDVVLARGLAGLPKEVYEAHRQMSTGRTLSWPAPSSCAFDRNVSEAYIKGEAANATKREGGSILFLVSDAKWGIALKDISKYPKEAEMLIPPFSKFAIDFREVDTNLSDALLLRMSCRGHNAPEDWCEELAKASDVSAKRLATALVNHAENDLREKQAQLDKDRARERIANSEAVKSERAAERQHHKLRQAEQDAQKAEERMDELERMMELQRMEVVKQRDSVRKQADALGDAEAACDRAAKDKEIARQDTEDSAEAVREAEEHLRDVRRLKEERRIQAQKKLAERKQETMALEKKKSEADQKVERLKKALQKAKAELDGVSSELNDANRHVDKLSHDVADAKRRRRELDDEEKYILEQEVRLVTQRQALEEKEAKHVHDLKSFDELYRPASPAPSRRRRNRSSRTNERGRDASPAMSQQYYSQDEGPGRGRSPGQPESRRRSPPNERRPFDEARDLPPSNDARSQPRGRASRSQSPPPPGGRAAGRSLSPPDHGRLHPRSHSHGSAPRHDAGLPPTHLPPHTARGSRGPSPVLNRYLTFMLNLQDEHDSVGLFWEGREDGNIYVKTVVERGAAWRAGIEPGLRLISVDAVPILKKDDLQLAMKDLRIKGSCQLQFMMADAEATGAWDKDQRIRELEVRLREAQRSVAGSPPTTLLHHPIVVVPQHAPLSLPPVQPMLPAFTAVHPPVSVPRSSFGDRYQPSPPPIHHAHSRQPSLPQPLFAQPPIAAQPYALPPDDALSPVERLRQKLMMQSDGGSSRAAMGSTMPLGAPIETARPAGPARDHGPPLAEHRAPPGDPWGAGGARPVTVELARDDFRARPPAVSRPGQPGAGPGGGGLPHPHHHPPHPRFGPGGGAPRDASQPPSAHGYGRPDVPRGISPAFSAVTHPYSASPSPAVPMQHAQEESLEKRIARLSAEVAASRERASREGRAM
ncbi:hypothetical protein DIPPA_17138 [Diplonema papillatum]|nr:hypothetical protein DIPPA_17138 [Diplonema papillatum]